MTARRLYRTPLPSVPPGSQKGAVLVMALLIVALVASLAVSFSSAFQLSLARGENRWHGAQATAYLLGSESLAVKALRLDAEDNKFDHLGEGWAEEYPPFPVDGGWFKGRVEDAQGRFNLNNLAGAPQQNTDSGSRAQAFGYDQRRFIRLLQTFEQVPVEQSEAIAIMEAVIDWLDTDDQPTGFGGAEAQYYEQQETPYHPANGWFSSVSELRLVRHVTPELYMALLPYVVVLPKDGTNLNVNTAAVQILRCLNDNNSLAPLSSQDAERVAQARGEGGYEEVADFYNSALAPVLPQGASFVNDGLSIASDYFLLTAEAQLVRQRRRLTSLLWRNNGEVKPVRRRDY